MGFELKELWSEFGGKYQMRLVAGESGLHRRIDWVHSIEDTEVARFLHGNELIFTTGIAGNMPERLLCLAESLYLQDACGLVVNLGPYIREIPEEVLTFCDQKAFPLFTIPWEIRLVDVTRTFTTRINENEFQELNLTEAFKNAIFNSGLPDLYLPYLKRGGCQPEAGFRAAAFWLQDDIRQFPDTAFRNRLLRSRIGDVQEQAVLFEQEGILILVFYGESAGKSAKAMAGLADFAASRGLRFFAGLGGYVQAASALSESYEQAVRTRRLAEKKNQPLLDYEELGTYKLILGCKDQSLLEAYVQETLGKLIESDQERETDSMKLLRDYLESGCSVSQVAERYFCHRNTITYQINKIKAILGVDLEDMGKRAEILLAFQVLDCLLLSTRTSFQ
ncbi:MAG: PucR family transcriptional regulator ligand-binding domain-containing protein [Eubacteriales bacterium]|nr:PucR family transcriptional regulator ligand-binding domain-containing protein [Eubacteriales bacterium]